MFTVWCTWNSVNNGGYASKLIKHKTELHLFQREVASLIDRVDGLMRRDIDVIVKDVKEPVEEVINKVIQ